MGRKLILLMILALIVPFLIVGCEGDDGATGATGATGEQGPQGPPGPPGPGVQADETCGICHGSGNIADVAAEHALEEGAAVTINSVTIASPPVVNFDVVFPAGSTADAGALTASNFNFAIAKLVPAAPLSGDSDSWQSYINRLDVHDEGEPGSTPVGTETTLAGTENNGTLVNNGNGNYTYTFATDVANVTAPIAVPFDNTLVHRVGIYLGGSIPRGDAVYTFIPNTGALVPTAREIVDVASCNECHQKLAAHHNQRFSTELCVICHNPGSVDALTGNTLDFKVMIHKIHRGEDLPSVVGPDGELGTADDGEYVINHHGRFVDFSNVVFPAGPEIPELRHCTKCHNSEVAVDAGNWITRPTREACGSCHDDVNFETGLNHIVGAQTNDACANALGCHGTASLNPEAVHIIPAVVERANFQYIIDNVTNTGPGEFPVVTFSVKNPVDNTFYDILNDPEFTTPGNARLAIDIGWDTSDYNNTGSGSSPAQPISINPVDNATGTVDNGDGTFTTISPTAIPLSATGTGVVAIEGHPASDDPELEEVPATSVLRFVPITDAAAVPRRAVVDVDNCLKCHIVLSLHGSNRTLDATTDDSEIICLICHNPNATDIRRREGVDPSNTPDGKKEEAIDFKRMIHAIHAGGPDHGFREEGIVVFGFGNSVHDYGEVRFPGILNNCTGCHLPGTFEVPLGADVLDTTVDTGDDRADPGDDLNITKTAAVCTSCHDSSAVESHAVLNGADFEFVAP